MRRLVHAEVFKLRTTSTLWLFAVATLLGTIGMLVFNTINAHSLLQPFDAYVALHTHGHGTDVPGDFLAHLRDDWTLGHSAVTQATTVYTSGRLLGVLLVCLLGIVLVTGEYQQQTATTTFLLTPRRTTVVVSKLLTAVLMATAAWLLSTLLSLVTGVVFLHSQGVSSQLGSGGVLRALLLDLAAYLLWAVLGVGLGALIRSQLVATVLVTVVYLGGAAVAAGLFELLNTYVVKSTWILTAQVIVPAVASAVMISPTATYTESPPQWVGAAVLLAYGVAAGTIGTAILRRRDVA